MKHENVYRKFYYDTAQKMKFFIKGTVMQIEKALIDDRL